MNGATASSPPLPIATEQRLLAAIVFTDVVGFSARMQRDEATTLKLVERDFAAMREFSLLDSGRVLKTTGDGLLLYFTSAVHAMEWALRTQRHFAEKARTEPPAEVLRHRVGVHLGEVFLKANDVMGDGVNIAARLQAEAPPGGICISQMVYDMVKNKSKLHVIRLEARKLKNISESIQMYHVLLEAPRPISPAPIATRPEPAAPLRPASSTPKKLAAIALLLLAMGVGAALVVQAHLKHEKKMAESQAEHSRLTAALSKNDGAPGGNVPGPAATTKPPSPATGGAGDFDFAKLTGDRPAGAPGTARDDRAIRQANDCMKVLDAWMSTGLPRHTRDRPLQVRQLRNPSFQNSTLFSDSNRQLYFAEGGATRKLTWQVLSPEVQGAIVVSALLASSVAPPRDVLRGAEAFAYVHGLPEMAEVLLRERRTGDRKSL